MIKSAWGFHPPPSKVKESDSSTAPAAQCLTYTSTSWHQKWLAIKGLQQSHCNPMSWAADAHGLLAAGCRGKNRGRVCGGWRLPKQPWGNSPEQVRPRHPPYISTVHLFPFHISLWLWGERIWDQHFYSIFCHDVTNLTNFMHCYLEIRKAAIHNGSLRKAHNTILLHCFLTSSSQLGSNAIIG